MSVCTRNASCTCPMCTYVYIFLFIRASLADMESINKPLKHVFFFDFFYINRKMRFVLEILIVNVLNAGIVTFYYFN